MLDTAKLAFSTINQRRSHRDFMEYSSQQLTNSFSEALTGNPSNSNTPQQTPGLLWHCSEPTPVSNPNLIAYFDEVAELLGITPSAMQSDDMLARLSGNQLFSGFTPYSACYGGHQFGHWAGQLGDGRAITIAELTHNNRRHELQLKGAGLTPYSRTADGRAVLRSSIREFLCSEAMHHLGIPTTRALSLVTTGDSVIRDVMYDGHPAPEPGAIVCRVAPSFIRFGNFELPAARNEQDNLNQLIDFTIEHDFPEISGTREQKVAKWFSEVCQRTAKMLIEWQRVGFVHGVMNTDNMSILGLTIDYGPYGWLDEFDSQWTPNTTDAQGRRYRFGNQPTIGRWNLVALANALASVIEDVEIFKVGIGLFDMTISQGMLSMQCNKFGLNNVKEFDEKNAGIINRAYELMQNSAVDFTLFFNQLTKVDLENPSVDSLLDTFYEDTSDLDDFSSWLKSYCQIIRETNVDRDERHDTMEKTNPKFILRNYLSQLAIENAEKGNWEELFKLMELLRSPYELKDSDLNYATKRPEWAKHKVGCSMLSCSS
ncbi:protein adenylyltransferase SelO [Pleionea sediminis]|uniref:protein adenylyltransferase SelO n=1 Tax=Pleionea sediminis TaxID=2569479 RepID=UPI00197B6A01|nr:YdiU family protein [Pleionea sediminis]